MTWTQAVPVEIQQSGAGLLVSSENCSEGDAEEPGIWLIE